MNRKNTPTVMDLYAKPGAFEARLAAAQRNAATPEEHHQIDALASRYEKEQAYAAVSNDEQTLLERLSESRTVIGPSNV